MARRATKRWWPILLVVLGFPVAAAASLSLTGGVLGSGVGTPATCLSGSPTIVQNVGTASPNTTNVVSVDVLGHRLRLRRRHRTGHRQQRTTAVQEVTGAIPAEAGP